ncbi:MAG TPA: FAD-dependent oxidoreductase [Rhodopila sp.]|uniref:NAD(P)/FAD-dependent oxidoreductase n=1 Tax=Rhodopila sp. TaxID=2480087 RepID=UPI002C4D01E9|nr:FAD-dependent oxidoreductase [Rhodopila sp.]HVY16555.1 FAD-dependent oxidoreductase [Rhodopila sp.]
MIRISELKLPLDHPPEALRAAVLARLGLADDNLLGVAVVRRGYDARRRSAISLVYAVDAAVRDEAAVLARDPSLRVAPDTTYRFPVRAADAPRRPVVIGAGPCGLMAALTLAEMGFRPLILERGKLVRERTRDTWGLWRRSVLAPESNVQFGEGGAGTFSDGKLYSGIKDPRHLGRRLLQVFVECGAPEEILWSSKPHIGTFRLVTVVEGIRARIEALGGTYRFGTRVEDLVLGPDRHVRGLLLSDGSTLEADHVVLAIGHSARDTFAMLHGQGVAMQAKPFSIGARIEHPQSLIDRARFGAFAGHPTLGAADYKLVHHASNGRSVYSFCMCPGGRVVAATSEAGHVATNGMSQYSRAEFNANAGVVVGITPEADYPGGPLAGIAFQREWERRAFLAGGSSYAAPAQRVGDLLEGQASSAMGEVTPSYRPGVTPADLAACLPGFAIEAIREALGHFARDIPGFAMHDAVLTGVETRTSSPLRILRGVGGESVNTPGLFPGGEGAGYAGGILSAGVDGIRVAEAVACAITGTPAPERMTRGDGVGVYG